MRLLWQRETKSNPIFSIDPYSHTFGIVSMNCLIIIGDRVKIGERQGEVFKITPLPNGSKEYRIAFDEGPPQSFICPPQVIEKVFSPIERLKHRDFDTTESLYPLGRLMINENHFLSLWLSEQRNLQCKGKINLLEKYA